MYSGESVKPIRRELQSVITLPSRTDQTIFKDNSGCTINEADLDDISNGLEQLQIVIAKKAAIISPLVHETTLGPQATTNNLSVKSIIFSNNEGPSNNIEIEADNHGTQKSCPSKINLDTCAVHQTSHRNDKLLFELDQRRRRCVNRSVNKRINQSIYSYKAAQDSGSSQRAVTDLHAHLDQERALKDAEEKAADEAFCRQREMLAQRQRQQSEREEAALLAEKVKREQDDHRMLTEFLMHEKEFQQICESLSESIKCCTDKQALVASNTSSFSSIKSLSDWMAQLATQISAGDMNHVALQKVSAITRQCDAYSKILQEEVKKINKNVLEREQQQRKIENQEREKAARELQAKEAADAAVAAARAAAVVTPKAETLDTAPAQKTEQDPQQQHPLPPVEMKAVEELPTSATKPAATEGSKKIHLGYLEGCVDAVSFQAYKKLTTYLAEFQTTFSQLSHDPQYKDFTFNCKKAVNIPVNAIGDQSGDHLLDKFHRLSTLLKGGTVQLSDVPFRATGHPQGIHFCMDLLASKLVDQGKTTVSSRAETAFPIAAIIVALWVEIPVFGQVIQAHFFKACPYLVPIFFPQVEGQSDEEYWKLRGYHFENGKPEKEASFVKKMGGIMQLYAAVIVSNVRRQQRAPHPLGLPEGWRWVACWVNIAPQPAISASLLLTFLEVAGNAMFAAYQHQFQKVLHLICKDYLQKIKETDTPGAGGYVSRLESFLHTMLKNGGIPPPRGALPAHFW